MLVTQNVIAIFRISMKNALKQVQINLLLVKCFLRYPIRLEKMLSISTMFSPILQPVQKLSEPLKVQVRFFKIIEFLILSLFYFKNHHSTEGCQCENSPFQVYKEVVHHTGAPYIVAFTLLCKLSYDYHNQNIFSHIIISSNETPFQMMQIDT